MYYYMSKVTNWHRHECIDLRDINSDMARKHGRLKLQAPIHVLKIKGRNIRSTTKVYIK